jgi:hypothetical protein
MSAISLALELALHPIGVLGVKVVVELVPGPRVPLDDGLESHPERSGVGAFELPTDLPSLAREAPQELFDLADLAKVREDSIGECDARKRVADLASARIWSSMTMQSIVSRDWAS